MTDYQTAQRDLVAKIRATVQGDPTRAKTIGSASTVGIRPDYTADDRLCLTSVAFVPPALGEQMAQALIEPLRQTDPNHYYYPPKSLHLTIKNIRTVDVGFTEKERELAARVFAQIIPHHPPVTFSFEEILVLPTSLSLIAYTDESFRDLVAELDRGLTEAGVPDNKRYYSDDVWFGNVTICRFTNEPSPEFRAAIERLGQPQLGSMTVDKISLIACNAVCAPTTLTVFSEYHLAAARRTES